MEAVEVEPTQPQQTVLTDALGRRMEANLFSVYITIRRPAARPQAEHIEVDATKEDGTTTKVAKGDMTNPCWKIDIHPIWRQIDANARQITIALDRYSSADSIKGEHLVSTFAVPQMLTELVRLRNERMELVRQLVEKWDDEVVAGIRAKFPDTFYQIAPRLPAKDSLLRRFDVSWVIRPLTVVTEDSLRLENLTDSQAADIIEANRQVASEMARERFQKMFDSVFGSVLEICEEVNNGGFETGRRQDEALEKILALLQRVSYFGAFATPEILQQIKNAQDTIKYIGSADNLNADKSMQQALRTAMVPLHESITSWRESQLPGSGRAGRSIRI